MKLSVALAVFNEEQNLPNCLDSIKNLADEIVLVDGQSTDNTRKIAVKYKAKISAMANDPLNFHNQKQAAIDKCQNEWILQLDADEWLTPALFKEINQVINDPDQKFDGFFMPRKNWFLGKFLTKGGAYPDPVIRLFKKSKAYFSKYQILANKMTTANVHGQIEIDGEIGTLKNDLIHNGDPQLGKYLSGLNRYTTIEATNLMELGLKPNVLNFFNYLFIKPSYWFVMRFFRHRGYVDGWPGFLFAWFSAFHYPIIYLKLIEMKLHGNSRKNR